MRTREDSGESSRTRYPPRLRSQILGSDFTRLPFTQTGIHSASDCSITGCLMVRGRVTLKPCCQRQRTTLTKRNVERLLWLTVRSLLRRYELWKISSFRPETKSKRPVPTCWGGSSLNQQLNQQNAMSCANCVFLGSSRSLVSS